VAGYFTHHDLLWVFHKIPYNKMSSTYGSGPLFHFAEQLYYVLGLPVVSLFLVGLVACLLRIVLYERDRNEHLLVLLGFLSFFAAHSIFWFLGIFNSMGLKRVLIGVIPFIAIIALQGFIVLSTLVYSQKQKFAALVVQAVVILSLVLFPFTSNPAAIHWKKEMTLGTDQRLAIQMAGLLSANRLPDTRIICAHPWFGEVLQLDWFDPRKRLDLNIQNIAVMNSSDILIWENWFAVVESSITREYLEKECDLKILYSLEKEEYGRKVEFVAYQKR
jgi:4-amino-4-deoxy-L-arabinose transferase-like glycosyltransferase